MTNRAIQARPLVSVVVPTRNSARTLGACLASIARQRYERLEVIVVDNHSSDGTREIASGYDCTVLMVGPERSAQRNRGARTANGSHLLFIDSDMVLEPGVVEECAAAARSGATSVIIAEISFGEGFWARCKRLERSCYAGDDEIEAARFFAKDLFLRIGGYDERLGAGEDWDLHQRARAEGARVCRITSFIHHDEGRLRLRKLLVKKFQYGRSLPLYRRKHPSLATRQFRLIRPAFIRNRKALAAEPLTFAGLVVMKTLEFSAGGAGALTSLAARRVSPVAASRRVAVPEDEHVDRRETSR
jgi:glycosyltransferase involved in cell wall biosynthesis